MSVVGGTYGVTYSTINAAEGVVDVAATASGNQQGAVYNSAITANEVNIYSGYVQNAAGEWVKSNDAGQAIGIRSASAGTGQSVVTGETVNMNVHSAAGTAFGAMYSVTNSENIVNADTATMNASSDAGAAYTVYASGGTNTVNSSNVTIVAQAATAAYGMLVNNNGTNINAVTIDLGGDVTATDIAWLSDYIAAYNADNPNNTIDLPISSSDYDILHLSGTDAELSDLLGTAEFSGFTDLFLDMTNGDSDTLNIDNLLGNLGGVSNVYITGDDTDSVDASGLIYEASPNIDGVEYKVYSYQDPNSQETVMVYIQTILLA